MTTTPTTPPSENFFNVAHATSLLAEDAPAFEHSVAIALAVGAPLYTVHATDGRYSIVEMPRSFLSTTIEEQPAPSKNATFRAPNASARALRT